MNRELRHRDGSCKCVKRYKSDDAPIAIYRYTEFTSTCTLGVREHFVLCTLELRVIVSNMMGNVEVFFATLSTLNPRSGRSPDIHQSVAMSILFPLCSCRWDVQKFWVSSWTTNSRSKVIVDEVWDMIGDWCGVLAPQLPGKSASPDHFTSSGDHK